MKCIPFLTLTAGMFFAATSCTQNPDATKSKKEVNTATIPIEGTIVAELTSPPFVPKPVGNRPATKLIVDLEIIEEEGEIADGVQYVFWTFGGTVPGSFIRGRVGDEVEFTLKNHPDNKLPHNIDLHSVTGQGGGAEASFVAPGQQKTFKFKLLNPGLYVYHCATAPVGMHIANGMYGLILVEPEGGLPLVDREYYVMQGDFYTTGKHGEQGLQAFDMQKAYDEAPDYVLFNGKVGALLDDGKLVAKVGETVRLYVGNGGPNLVSSFHVIGEIFDKVYVEGGSLINENIQTTLIPAGGATIVDFKVETPANLLLVDHSIMRTFNKGSMGILAVEGAQNNTVFEGGILEGIYQPEGSVIQADITKDSDAPEMKPLSFEEKMDLGRKVYNSACFACHQSSGEGINSAFPPLAQSDYLNADTDRSIDVILRGLSGEIVVNGKTYNSQMPAQRLNDQEVASVLTYIYNSWGNNKSVITEEQVKARR